MSDEDARAWRDEETGMNVLAEDFDPERDAEDPEQFRELFDQEPRLSVIQPGGALFKYIVDGRPGVRDD
ncbi:hypothetical protein [Halalkalicoccus subterraneus]|uniref:hypothetical protein n=1 Tax=Halalkalicoccus subterraneus TaxID=2675002 RepID=UPI000EFBE268|nr:hypothetical protein [Halalkalicoccus subterraneus]